MDRAIDVVVRGLRLVVPPALTAALLLAGLELAGWARPPPGPAAPTQVVAWPEPVVCPEVAPPPPDPVPAAEPAVVIVERGAPGDLLGVVDVRRSELARLLASRELLGSTRLVVHQTDGRPDGVRVYGVRAGTLLFAAGLRSGDLITEVNGLAVTSPDGALQLHASSLRHLDVRLLRRGRPARLLVFVHDA